MTPPPNTIEGVGALLVEVWSTTKLLVDEVHSLHAKLNMINEVGCRHHREITGPVHVERGNGRTPL